MKSLALSLILLACAGSSRAADPPFYLRAIDSQKDVGAINENFRANSDAIRNLTQQLSDLSATIPAASTTTGYAFLQATQTFSGGETFTQSVSFSSAVSHASTTTFSFNGPVSTPTANALYANNIVKAWVDFDGTVPSINDGFNVARIVYTGTTGFFQVVWATPFASANYFVSCSDGGGADFDGGPCGIAGVTGAKTASSVTIVARDDGGARRNFTHIYVLAIGKQ